MKQTLNRLAKLSRSVTLSPKHYRVIMDMAERVGCVKLLPPNAGTPNMSIFLEAIAEGRLAVYDAETMEEVRRSKEMSIELAEALKADRENNFLNKESPLTSRRFLLNQAIKNIRRANKTNKRKAESN